MKRLITALITMGLGAASLPCRAQSDCGAVEVRANVEASPGGLNLADLFAPGTCVQLYALATKVSLGAAPRPGSLRVLDGGRIRRLVDGLGDNQGRLSRSDDLRIPQRIFVRQAGAVKSCAEIAGFVSSADPLRAFSGDSARQNDLDCAGARNIPEESSLELLKSIWNSSLHRREFALRCVRPEDCIPFLVWAREKEPAVMGTRSLLSGPSPARQASGRDARRLIDRGQTATLTWDRAGIRVVLPVTCLEAGAAGQFIRIRFKNSPQTLRAEIVGAGTLRASL